MMLEEPEGQLSSRIVCSESILVRVYRVLLLPAAILVFLGSLDAIGNFQWDSAVTVTLSGISGLWVILLLWRNSDIPKLFFLQGDTVHAVWRGGRKTITKLTDVAVETSESPVLAIQYVVYLGPDHFPISKFAENIGSFVSEVTLRGGDLY
jgi:hypothetical protein